ncbi:Zinc phosphodiesterase ELAC protein 2 [Lobaria immixta]|nr:Zinc phosphodiesterase ELAC protein 2 [Lobaria immixta]
MRAPLGLGWSKHKVENIHKLRLSWTIRARDPVLTTQRRLLHSPVRRPRGVLGRPSNRPTKVGFSVIIGLRTMHAWIQFITTPTVDTPGTALLLHFDDKRYIIGNIHEGLTRACIQMGVKLTKASEIFITGKTEWKNTGGLMGVVMTLADITTTADVERINKKSRAQDKKPSLTIHGGANITHTLATGRRFIFRKGMPVQVKEYLEPEHLESSGRHKSGHGLEPGWADPHIQVWAMVIEPSSAEQPTTAAESKSPRKRSFNDFAREGGPPTEGAKLAELKESSPGLKKDICANVVMEMFASSWQKDSLQELPLAEVGMLANIFVRNKVTKKIEQYTGPRPGGEVPVPDIRVLVRKPWPAASQVRSLPRTKPSHSAISYIIRCQRQRGKFLVEKAQKWNVPPGPLRAMLTRGADVRLKDGTIIKPEMVLGEGKDGGGVVVADLPSQDYIHGLLSRPEWKALEVMTGVEAVIWILGAGVSQNEGLQNFINDHKHLKHIISSPDHGPNYLAFGSSARVSNLLNQVDPPRFPIPIHDNVTLPDDGQRSMDKIGAPEIIYAEPGLKVQLEPSVSIQREQREQAVSLTVTGDMKEELSESVRGLAEHARREILSEPTRTEMDNQQLPSPDAEIICLGTGSASPSKYRNVSATLLRVPGAGSYLLDCGENTLGQLRRLYSPTELAQVLRDLKVIWISHLHADHHLGITSVIKAWYEEVHGTLNPAQTPWRNSLLQGPEEMVKALVSETRLCIISPRSMQDWLREYSSVENFGFDRLVQLAPNPITGTNARLTLEWIYASEPVTFDDNHSLLTNTLKSITGLADIRTCFVSHCLGAQAIALTFPDGFKFSYSGDCRPSSRFVEIGRGSTVLLHEATFEDERRGDARAKKHSTTSEAIAVGKKMGARRILLTHFSQRYSKTPVGMESMNLELGFDEDAEDLAGGTNQVPIPLEGMNMDIPMDEITQSQGGHAQPIPSTSESTSSFTNPGAVQGATTNPGSEDTSVRDLKVGVAFDYMKVKVKDIMLLEKFAPALVKLFEEAESEDPEEEHVEKPDTKPEMVKKKTGERNAMVESGHIPRSARGDAANGAESNELANGVGVVQVQNAKQETPKKSEPSDDVVDLGTTLPDTTSEAAAAGA